MTSAIVMTLVREADHDFIESRVCSGVAHEARTRCAGDACAGTKGGDAGRPE